MFPTSSLAAQGYGQARPATRPAPAEPALTQGASAAAQDFARALQDADTTARATMLGGGDPHALVTALSEAQLAVETTVALRDRVVDAYLEILRMPV